jgi:hypothetical protein
MSHWILQNNPNSFRLTQGSPILYYQAGDEDWWGISRYFKTIAHGDVAYIWQSLDHRRSSEPKPRGIYAKATIESVEPHAVQHQVKIARLMKQDSGAWLDPKEEQHQKSKRTVLITYLESYALNPLTAEELTAAGLSSVGPLRFHHSDIYCLSDAECRKIETLLKGR